jgi:hypothetical protein
VIPSYSLRADVFGMVRAADQSFSKYGHPSGGVVGPLGGAIFCMRDIFIVNEIRVQNETYILVGTFLG